MQENINVLLERAEKEALTKVCKVIDFVLTQDTKNNYRIIIYQQPHGFLGESTVQGSWEFVSWIKLLNSNLTIQSVNFSLVSV